MNNQLWEKVETIVDKALSLPQKDRQEFINKECRDSKALKTEVTTLLDSISNSEGWLEDPQEFKGALFDEIADDVNQLNTSTSLTGKKIGSYLIQEQLGEGGMGLVYLAERSDGEFEHQVAIKIIRNEKASAENIRRFEQERTIMAGLSHPGIAKLFDGGITKEGFPYFIMEYVDGIPIDQYCQKHNSTIAERIEICKQVLQAVRHAHENLVVHRDLKPGNILVNTSGNVKILDFGISKLLQEDQISTTKTGARLLTPKYASPEQILESNITTATDIYALGIIFYQLFADTFPFDFEELSHYEIEQTILEKTPSPPSSQVRSSKRRKALRGDLDAIVLKAIRKEPDQRYRSANDFLDDLEKYQKGLPVEAREDSVKYRTHKFFSRHKQAAATIAGVILLIMGFIGFFTWQITEERNRAQLQSERAEEMTDFLLSLFEANNPRENTGEDFPVSEVIERGIQRIEKKSLSTESRALLLAAIGQIQLNIGQTEEAGKVINQAYRLVSDSIQTKSATLIDIYTVFGNWNRIAGGPDSARTLFQVADSLHKVVGSTGSEFRVNLINLANLYNEEGDYQKALDALHRIKHFPEESREALHNKSYYFNNIAVAYAGLGNNDKSLEYYEKSLRLKEKIYEPGNPELALPYSNIAVVYLRLGLSHRSYELFKKAYNIRKKAYGIDHPMMGSTLSGLATTANKIGKTEESERFHKLALTNVANNYGIDHYRYAFALRNYAKFLIDAKLFEQAEDSLNTAHKIITDAYGSNHALNAYITNIKATLYKDWNKAPLANSNYQKTINLLVENYGPDYKRLSKAYSSYGIFKYEQNQIDEAIQLLEDANKIFKPAKSFVAGKNLYYLGKSHLSIGNQDSAQLYLRDAYNIVSKAKSDTIPLAKEIQHFLSDNF